MLHIVVFWNFLRYPAWAAGRHLILLCNVHAAKTATLSPGLISASQGFIQQMQAHLQMAMSASSRGSNWWWSLPTGRRPLEPICICYNAGSIKTCFFAFLAPMQTVHHWLSEKANISHIFIKILNMVFSLSHRYSLPTATQLIANMINWLYHIFVCGIDSLFSLIMKVDLVLIKYILSLHSKIHLWMVHKYTRLSNFSLYYRNYRIIWLSLCSIIQIHYFIIFLRIYYLSIFSVFITSDDLWWHNKRF